MITYSKILIGVLAQGLVIQVAFGQTKKSLDSADVKAKIKPQFSEMTDYGLPTNKEGIHEFPGGRAPVSNQINPDGSVRINKTGEIIVPADVIRTKEISKDINAEPDPKIRVKKKKK